MAEAPARRMALPVFLVEDGLVTDAQVRRFRAQRMAGKTLAAARAPSDLFERRCRLMVSMASKTAHVGERHVGRPGHRGFEGGCSTLARPQCSTLRGLAPAS